MKIRIIEVKNDRTGLSWAEYDPRPNWTVIDKTIRRLRADERINNFGFEYRIKTINE
jgi:hypothetical protein